MPSSAWAAGELPALTTTPAPSLPTGIDWSTRPAMPGITLAGTLAVSTGRSGVPPTFAVPMSAAPNSRPRSDGFTGAASMRTSTSSGAGSGTGTSASVISSSPLLLISERSCRAVEGSVMFMEFLGEG